MAHLFLSIILVLQVMYGTGSTHFSSIKNFLSNYADSGNQDGLTVSVMARSIGKNICDENKLLFHLAKLLVISPERIILLLTGDTTSEICPDIINVKNRIKADFRECIPLSPDNLYMKLFEGVRMLFKNICQDDNRKRVVEKHQPCLRELREEYIDCEGPTDWFERTNRTILCQIFVDILNCDYIKTAELCGMEAAFTIRSISIDIFKPILPNDCRAPRSLPKIKQPIPAGFYYNGPISYIIYLLLCVLICFLY